MEGTTLGHYEVLEKIGEGGMGAVYRARDTRLNRLVALKILPRGKGADPESRRRFVQEARAASALNHPGIVTIYDADSAAGVDFIAMELVAGKTLDRMIPEGGMRLDQAVDYAVQICDALVKAHEADIVHRDLKPRNIMVTNEGRVKILDFGLAKLLHISAGSEDELTKSLAAEASPMTRKGTVLGTVDYMAPEQAEGKSVDQRTDLFSFGVVLYEMLSGRKAFHRDSTLGTLAAILRDDPTPVESVRKDVPESVQRILDRMLRKKPEERYASAGELERDLAKAKEALDAVLHRRGFAAWIRKPVVAVALVLAVIAAGAAGGWAWHRKNRVEWARTAGVAEVARLLAAERGIAAFDLAVELKGLIPDDPQLLRLWPEVAHTPLIESEPAGAEVYFREMGDDVKPWRRAGTTPMRDVSVPHGYFQWKLVKAGYADTTGAACTWWARIPFLLPEAGGTAPDMVLVPGAEAMGASIGVLGQAAPRDPYLIDRYEVTNKQFKTFIDKGGYTNREYWKQPFKKDGKALTWEQAMAEFRDATGRPGPSTWEGGSYPEGQEEYPVAGVSWYEAAAYAEFAGKTLPAAYHWFRAADVRTTPFVIPNSNFGGKGTVKVGSQRATGPFGTFDMAGNVKEWAFNETDGGFRFILGGSWNSPTYQFNQPDAKPPFNRDAANGFRCARYLKPPDPGLLAMRPSRTRDYAKEKPVSDEVFKVLKNTFAYDAKDLKAAVDETDDSSPYWRLEKVSFDAAYAGERVPALVFLPKGSKPPYQAIVYHPGAGARTAKLPSIDGLNRLDFIIRSGRAVIYPIYLDTYQRSLGPAATPLESKGRAVKRAQDHMRSIEYAVSRPDIDPKRLGYVGVSWGAAWAPLMITFGERFKTAVLYEGGLYSTQPAFPEVDLFNYLPRVKIPVLMLNGRYDYTFPLETSQKPFFKWLGTPEADKRHILYDTAHDVTVRRTEVVREVLNWLDKYLGPVAR